jgi:RNA polymerase sigma-70 factor (ECF subfamily)
MVDDEATKELLGRATGGDREALDCLLSGHRSRLRQMIALRLDPRLSSRIDASDIVQETFMEVSRKLPEYTSGLQAPFYLWLRKLAMQRLLDLSRKHIAAECRSVTCEAVEGGALLERSSMQLAAKLMATQSSPSQHAQRRELRSRVRNALTRMDAIDQEVLVLRYLEELSTCETALVLGITERAVRYRQRNAMEQLARFLRDTGP